MKYFRLLLRSSGQASVLSTVLLICILFAVAGCGGGGSDYNEVSGVAAKGLIREGLVKVYKIDEAGGKGKLLATTMTDQDGYYSIRVLSATGFYVEVTGGTYVDEATGVEIERDASDVLRAAATNHVDGELTLAVTDLTEIAVRIALKMEGGLTRGNIDASNTNVSKLLGVDAAGKPVMDITKVNPVDICDPDAFGAGDESQKRYAKMLAVISQADQNDTEKESGDILDDLAAYLGGHAPAGSVSMETTLAQAAADFFNAANEHNVTGETEFDELREVVAGARYTSPERVTGISVFQAEAGEELKGVAPGSTGDQPLGEATFSYDAKNNLSKVSIAWPDDPEPTIIGELIYEESGDLASVNLKEGSALLFELINSYDGDGLLENTVIKEAFPDPLTVNFIQGNLYHIASCLIEGGDSIGLSTTIDDAGLLETMTLDRDAHATIRRLDNGRIDRVVVTDSAPDKLSIEAPSFVGGNWLYYDGDGNLKTVLSLYDIEYEDKSIGTEGADALVATLYEAKDKGFSEFSDILAGYTYGKIQYTEYSYIDGVNGGKDIAQIDVRLISESWNGFFREDGDYSVVFTDLTEAGNAQKIELYEKVYDDLVKASGDRLMGYATLTYEKGQMKRNMWANAFKEAIRIAYRNVCFIGVFNRD